MLPNQANTTQIRSEKDPIASTSSESILFNDKNLGADKIDKEQNDHQFLSDDEDFCSSAGSSMENLDQLEGSLNVRCKSEPNLNGHVTMSEDDCELKLKTGQSLKSKMMKGVSLGNLRLPSTPIFLKKAKSSCELSDKWSEIEENDSIGQTYETPMNKMHVENFKSPAMNNWSLMGTPKINFMNSRNSMSPITKSTQRMPKFMQVCLDINKIINHKSSRTKKVNC